MNNLQELWNGLRKPGAFTVYAVLVLFFFGFYVWSDLQGSRFFGDDADTKEQHGGFTQGGHRSHRSHFYHK